MAQTLSLKYMKSELIKYLSIPAWAERNAILISEINGASLANTILAYDALVSAVHDARSIMYLIGGNNPKANPFK